jgi:hypothetical protein
LETVFCMRSVPRLNKEDHLSSRESLETTVRRVGYWCEMAASLRGREPRSRGTSTVERRHVTENTSLCVTVICKVVC